MVKIMYARHTARLLSLLWNCAVILLLGVIVLLSHLSEGVHATVWQLALLLCGINMAATLLAYALFCKFTAGSYHTFDGFFYRRYRRGEELLCIRWEDVYAMEYTKSAWLFLGDVSAGELLLRYRVGDAARTETVSVSGKELKYIQKICPRYIGVYP